MGNINRRGFRTAIVAAVMAALVIGPSALAAPGGNNGTVKVHEGHAEPSAEMRNEPHVFTFHLHFYFSDAGQAGDWVIDAQSPSDANPGILSGSYLSDASGEFQTVEMGLPIGHYTLNWDGRNDQNLKHKTFWVTCENPAGPIDGQPTT